MEAIVILAKALSKAMLSDISSLEIFFDAKEKYYVGKLILTNNSEFTIFECGKIIVL